MLALQCFVVSFHECEKLNVLNLYIPREKEKEREKIYLPRDQISFPFSQIFFLSPLYLHFLLSMRRNQNQSTYFDIHGSPARAIALKRDRAV